MSLTAQIVFCLSSLFTVSLASAGEFLADRGEFVRRDGDNVPENLRPYLWAVALTQTGHAIQYHLRSMPHPSGAGPKYERIPHERPSSWVQGGFGTIWYAGDGLMVTAGHVIADSAGAGNALDFGSQRDGRRVAFEFQDRDGWPVWLTLNWGQIGRERSMELSQWRELAQQEMRQLDANGDVLRSNNQVRMTIVSAQFSRGTMDHAVLRIPDPWPWAPGLPVADGTEDIRVGDRVITLGYPNGGSEGLFKYEGTIEQVWDEGSVTVSSAVPFGVSGGPIFHVRSGKVIALAASVVVVSNTTEVWTGPVNKPVLMGESIPATRLSDMLAGERSHRLGCGHLFLTR